MNFSSLIEIIRKATHSSGTLLVLASVILTSCAGTKFLSEGEQILNKQSVEGVGPKMKDHMATLYEQEPNTRMFLSSGPAHLVYVYEFGKKRLDTAKQLEKKDALITKFDDKIYKAKRDRKKKRLLEKKQQKVGKVDRVLKEGNQLMRWGEPLAIYDKSKIDLTQDKISQYLNSRGYYANKVRIEESYKDKDSSRVEVKYAVKRGPEYFIDSIQLVIPDKKVMELYMKNINSTELKKRKIRQLDLTAERDRVYQLMVNNGYFGFSKDLVYFQIDSVSLGPQKLLVREIINNPPNQNSHQVFEIDSVIFVTDAGFNINKEHDNKEFKDITYTFGRFTYSTKILDWHTYLYPDNLYQRNDVLETQRQLSYMDNFKFINVNFDTLGGQFTAHIFTSPADRYQTSSEVGLSVTQGLPGPFANLNLKNRNLFRGLEIVELNSNFKVEGLGGVSNRSTTYSSLQYGSELSITFPQFLSPLGQFYKKKISKFNPRTRFGLAFGHEDRFNEYRRTTVNTSMAYIWKVQDHVSYTLTPMEMSYIDSKTDSTFQVFLNELAASGNTYANAFNSAFVGSGSFQVIVNNNYGVSRGSSYIQFYIETGGHLFSLLGSEPFGNSLEYFKYAKTSIDFRKNFYLNRKTSLVTRINLGVAVPYGDNRSLPYQKYFFGGGSNSLRAWKPRRLGPGAYGEFGEDENGVTRVNYQREQPGDMSIELSAEVRQKLIGFVDWAFFVDAGNVWLLNSETVNPALDPDGDDGVFKFNTFGREMAVGSGIGFRFDLSFLIFRLDLGWKLVDPAQKLGNRWVGNKIFPKPLSNSEINIGIGYPF